MSIDVTNTTGDDLLLDQGDVLTVNTNGVTTPGTLTVSCQWYRNGAEIVGATATTYTVGSLSADPAGTFYNVKVTGTGNYSDTLESAAKTVYEVPLAGSVAITGTTTLGGVLALDASLLTPAGATYGISWLRDGSAIGGASSASYTILKADQGKTISVVAQAYGYFTGTRALP